MTIATDELQDKLLEICPTVYFMNPPKSGMQYPCIVLTRKFSQEQSANNRNYKIDVAYQASLLARTPGGEMQKKMMESFEHIHWENEFIEGGLTHSIFTIYYRI